MGVSGDFNKKAPLNSYFRLIRGFAFFKIKNAFLLNFYYRGKIGFLLLYGFFTSITSKVASHPDRVKPFLTSSKLIRLCPTLRERESSLYFPV